MAAPLRFRVRLLSRIPLGPTLHELNQSYQTLVRQEVVTVIVAPVASVKPAAPPIRAPPVVAAVLAHMEPVPVTANLLMANLPMANLPMARMEADRHNISQSIFIDFGGDLGNSLRGSSLLLLSKMNHQEVTK